MTSNKSRIAQLELNIKTLSDEVIKANEIIRKLQQESKSVHAKVNLYPAFSCTRWVIAVMGAQQ